MKEFLKNHRAQCAKTAKDLGFWWCSRIEDTLGV